MFFDRLSLASVPAATGAKIFRHFVWILIGLCFMFPVMGITHEAGAGTKVVKSQKDPVFVTPALPSPLAWLNSESERAELTKAMTRQMRDAAKAHPQRVIVLRIAEQQFQYERLPNEIRAGIAAISGEEAPKNFYERRFAGVLQQVLSRTRLNQPPLMLSVQGLPLESNANSAESANITNRNYRQVIDAMELVVARRTLLIRGGDAGALVQNALPKSLMLANGRAVMFRTNAGWRLAASTDGPQNLNEAGGSNVLGTNEPQALPEDEPLSPIMLLLMDWGETDSPWDLNRDGIVGVADLLLLIRHWEQYSGGLSGSGQSSVAQWVNPPLEYVRGSGQNIKLQLLSGAPNNAHVVFQTWSEVTQSIEATHQDWTEPFEYPASVLDQVTLGAAEIQALVRKPNNTIVETVRANVLFVAPESPSTPEPPAPTNPPPANNPPSTPTGGGSSSTPPPASGGSTTPPTASSSPGADPNAPAPLPAIVLQSVAGEAPFTVHAHGLTSDLRVGTPITARYEWNFGDPDGAYNTLVGFNAAHVYDAPGVYTVTLKVINEAGKAALATAEVTVSPASRTVYYVADTGNDANPGTSINTPIRSIAKVAELMTDNVEFRFRRAGTYDVLSPLAINSSNVTISSYGNGAAPVLRWTAGGVQQSILECGSDAARVVVENVTFTSTQPSLNATTVAGMIVRGSNVTVRNCEFLKVGAAMRAEAGGVNGWLTMGNVSGVIGSHYAWCQGQNICHVNNQIGGSINEHAIVTGGAQRVLVAHNDITNAAKSTLWCMLVDYATVYRNTLRSGRFSAGPNSSDGASSERSRFVVFEANQMFDQGVILYSGLEDSVLRNNVIRFDGGEAFSIWGYYAPKDRTCRNISVLNNAAINTSNTYGKFVRVGIDAENVVVANNVYAAPSLNAQNGAANAMVLAGDLDGMSFRRNLWANPQTGSNAHLVAGVGQSANDWASHPQVVLDGYRTFTGTEFNGESPTPLFDVLIGEAMVGVLADFNGKLRPVTGVISVGAVEMGNSVTPLPTSPPPSSGGSSTPPPTSPPPSSTPPPPTPPAPEPPPAPTPPPAPPSSPPPGPTQSNSQPINLSNGATTIANKIINGSTGVVGDNATSVTTLNMNYVTINSTNYGVYLGSCQNANFDRVIVNCSPNGPDSYSVRGHINSFVSKDSEYHSGIKAFRIYGLTGGSSLRDTITGDRLMLGGGAANEWSSPLVFKNFTFTDTDVDVNSVEIYDNTHHVTFNQVNFAGTGHISIMAGAHHLTFNQCENLPEVKYFDSSGRIYPTPAQLAARNIVFND